jgi:hypothetical protein
MIAVRQNDRTVAVNAPIEVKFARINATADGDNTIVAAVATKKIRVLAMLTSAVVTGVITYKSGAATTLFTMYQANASPTMFEGNGYWICETVAGEAFVINNPAGTDTTGFCLYCEV